MYTDQAFDSLTYCWGAIDSDHQMIHRQKFFTVSQTTASVAASSWIDFYFVASTSYEIHLKQIDFNNSGGLTEVYVCEGLSTGSSVCAGIGGTTAIVYNRDRNSTFAPVQAIFKNTTWASTAGGITSSMVGDIISHFYIGTSGTALSREGGNETNKLEWLLKSGTTYVFRIYNQGAAGAVSLSLHYYYSNY